MNTVIEGQKVVISLEVSVEYNGTEGFLICEKDGPHVRKWGPMPGFLVQAFLRERAEQAATVWRQLANDVIDRAAH